METEMFLTGFDLNVNRMRRKFQYFQFILSKLAYEGLNENESNNLWIMTQDFYSQRYPKLSELVLYQIQHEILKKGNLKVKRQGQKYWNISNQIRNLILGPHEYYGLKFDKIGKFFSSVKLLYKIDKKTSFPPLPYIGVGYKDKGKMSDSSLKAVKEANQFFHRSQNLIISSSRFSHGPEDRLTYLGTQGIPLGRPNFLQLC